MHHGLVGFFTECPVFLIDIEIIILMKIISNIEVRPSIQVDVSRGYTQSITDYRTIDSRFMRYIGKMISIIPEHAVARQRMISAEEIISRCKISILVYGMIQQKHIQVTIHI